MLNDHEMGVDSLTEAEVQYNTLSNSLYTQTLCTSSCWLATRFAKATDSVGRPTDTPGPTVADSVGCPPGPSVLLMRSLYSFVCYTAFRLFRGSFRDPPSFTRTTVSSPTGGTYPFLIPSFPEPCVNRSRPDLLLGARSLMSLRDNGTSNSFRSSSHIRVFHSRCPPHCIAAHVAVHTHIPWAGRAGHTNSLHVLLLASNEVCKGNGLGRASYGHPRSYGGGLGRVPSGPLGPTHALPLLIRLLHCVSTLSRFFPGPPFLHSYHCLLADGGNVSVPDPFLSRTLRQSFAPRFTTGS